MRLFSILEPDPIFDSALSVEPVLQFLQIRPKTVVFEPPPLPFAFAGLFEDQKPSSKSFAF